MTTEITSILNETRVFDPPKAFSSDALVDSMQSYHAICKEATDDPESYWGNHAKELLTWETPYSQVLDWSSAPFAKWFTGGRLNITENCLDRHLKTWRRNKAAIIWEGEPGDSRVLTYQDLHREVCIFANVLKNHGIVAGDRVVLYMPMVPELAIAMLACARIGATHSIIFGGFSAEAIKERVNDAGAKLVITADGGYRRGATVPLKNTVDAALEHCPTVSSVIVLKRTGENVSMVPQRDHWWHETVMTVSASCEAVPLDSEHPLFILYTSGSTGKPKGVMHTTAGYLLNATLTTKWIFDLKDTDTYWCTADIGWVTGHSYVIYGPLSNGATTVMYEGAPNWPEPDRMWQLVEKYGVTIFYTAPTAIRAFMKWGEQWADKHNLSTLRLLGTVGEPINPEAWMWYHRVIGKERCPIVDTWWQTETGGIMVAPFPGATPTKPGTATLPLPGIDVAIVNKHGEELPRGQGGFLVVRKPWPSMLRTLWGDDERFVNTYWKEIPGMYFTGDGAYQDENGYVWIMGRVDDVINVSGHRLGTMEIESALVSHPAVVEAAVVGRPDDLKGQAVAAFVTLGPGETASDALKTELKAHVVKEIGALARPDDIRFTDALPKTRSGKIMRRLLRDIAAGKETVGDTTTIEDYGLLARLRQDEE
ncbi:MAG: acetate--CoA ligase [Candidatus Sericytochromatia bacterium]|nr:acetate--CoA ligase [Candidatus Sericytochromatia bacterium]